MHRSAPSAPLEGCVGCFAMNSHGMHGWALLSHLLPMDWIWINRSLHPNEKFHPSSSVYSFRLLLGTGPLILEPNPWRQPQNTSKANLWHQGTEFALTSTCHRGWTARCGPTSSEGCEACEACEAARSSSLALPGSQMLSDALRCSQTPFQGPGLTTETTELPAGSLRCDLKSKEMNSPHRDRESSWRFKLQHA